MYIKIHFYLFLFVAYMFYAGRLEFFLIFYFSALLHEISHIVMSLFLNVDVIELYLLPFGVNAKYEMHLPFVKEFLISLAGPLMSLFLAIFSKDYLVQSINFSIFLLNLVPIYPLDGGRIQKITLILLFGFKKGIKMCLAFSYFWLIIVLIIAILFIIFFKNFYLLFLTLYLFTLSIEELKKEKLFEAINCLQIEQKCIK